MADEIRVAVNTRPGLQREILTGAIRQDEGMAVVDVSPQTEGTADVLIVAEMRDARQRTVLHTSGKVIAVDGHDAHVDLYEMRPLGKAQQAADLTGVIRRLTQRYPAIPARTRAWRWLRALLNTQKGRAP